MSVLRADELEIVGFNGAPLVECGRTLPVARRKSDRMYCVLEVQPDSPPPTWHSEDEARAFAAAHRWTVFQQPLSLPRSCEPDAAGRFAGQPMAVFAADHLRRWSIACRIATCGKTSTLSGVGWRAIRKRCRPPVLRPGPWNRSWTTGPRGSWSVLTSCSMPAATGRI